MQFNEVLSMSIELWSVSSDRERESRNSQHENTSTIH
jgi:hypothetical protein